MPERIKAKSFEQEMLWSILDHDPVAAMISVAEAFWGIGPDEALEQLKQQWRCGRVAVNRYDSTTGRSNVPVDLETMTPSQAQEDHYVFMDPTKLTFSRLNEIGGAVGMSG